MLSSGWSYSTGTICDLEQITRLLAEIKFSFPQLTSLFSFLHQSHNLSKTAVKPSHFPTLASISSSVQWEAWTKCSQFLPTALGSGPRKFIALCRVLTRRGW